MVGLPGDVADGPAGSRESSGSFDQKNMIAPPIAAAANRRGPTLSAINCIDLSGLKSPPTFTPPQTGRKAASARILCGVAGPDNTAFRPYILTQKYILKLIIILVIVPIFGVSRVTATNRALGTMRLAAGRLAGRLLRGLFALSNPVLERRAQMSRRRGWMGPAMALAVLALGWNNTADAALSLGGR